MNLDDIEKRLRRPHPLERNYVDYRRRPTVRVIARPSFVGRPGVSLVLVVLVIAGLAVAVRFTSSQGPGALPQPSNLVAEVSPEPTKPFVSIPPESPAPLVTAAACAPGSVRASLIGWGGAMGSEGALVRIEPLRGTCSLLTSPAVAVIDNTGVTLANSQSPSGGNRIELSSALEARISVYSLCPASPPKSLVMVIDLGNGNIVRVPMPARFGPACNGGSNQVSVDDLFVAP